MFCVQLQQVTAHKHQFEFGFLRHMEEERLDDIPVWVQQRV